MCPGAAEKLCKDGHNPTTDVKAMLIRCTAAATLLDMYFSPDKAGWEVSCVVRQPQFDTLSTVCWIHEKLERTTYLYVDLT